MIQAIKELNFPPYATLSQATATMHDMGDRTITADIKIDGAITPDFSYDWEVEFKGDKYIQPLRKPQGSKGDKSSMSTINLTFYHWAIYQLKRYFFVELASTQAGTAFADKYIVPLSVNLGEFVVAFNNVLSYYFPDGDIYIDLNLDRVFDAERKYIDINNTYLWDVLQKTHELFGVRWVMERDANGKYAIRINYPAGELTHIFEYGFEGGLLNIERQVQDANIRNKILGRGGSKNIPYLYFKDFDKYPQGGDGNQGMIPDPDAIPELTNIYFSELRDSNFRSYVQGWKTNANRLLIEGDTLDEFDAERAKTDYAYMRGATDEKFDPVEYVKDDTSIAEYGELVGRLENNEDIYPSLQGMNIELTSLDGNTFVTKADEVVAVQEVNTDSIASDEAEVKSDIKLEAKSQTSHGAGSNTFTALAQTITVSSDEIEVPEGYEGTLFDTPTIKYTLEWKERIKQYMQYKAYSEGDKVSANTYKQGDNAFPSVSYKVIDVITNKEVTPVNVPEGRYRVDYTLNFPSVTLGSGIIHAQQTPSGLGQTERLKVYWLKRNITTSAAIICKSFNGDVILNKVDGVAISKSVSVDANSKATISITGDTFSVPEQGAIMVDAPISVTPATTTTYSEKTIKVVNANTNEIVPATNIPEGEYKLLVDVTLTNESSSAKTLKVELLPSLLYFIDNTEKWEPTFDVWIKNIFNTKKSDYPSDASYVEGVWSPLRTEDEMVLTFSSGNLSGHDSWEFKVKKGGIAYDNSKVIVDANGNEVRSEWRLTLIKSDAELETIKKYIPYKDFNAKAGDTFFFTGIILPHQYVLSAEKDVTSWKQDNLDEVKDIKPQWVISLDKVRAHREDADRLIDLLHVGAVLTLKDKRFTKNVGERQVLQSITFEWQETFVLPTINVVLSDKVTTSLSTTAMLQGKVDALARQVGGLSNLEQIIRKVGGLLYLRKDGFEDTSYSPTRFADIVSSENFKPGAIGGSGWGAYTDENGNSVIEADKLFIRNEMQVNSLIVNQIAALGGTKILSAADMTISAVEPVVLDDGSVGERCFFDTKGSSKSNLFAVDDIAYSDVFDSENLELKYYKRRVVDVGVDYITLSTTDKDGEGSPQVGDIIVQFGNFTDTTRQSFIIIDPLNGGKIEIYAGVNSFNLTDKNMIGMGVNPTTNKAFLYGYGDMFFGDRNRVSNFITFQGGKMIVNAEVIFGADSTGLSNLSEFNTLTDTVRGVQDQIDGVVENWSAEGHPYIDSFPVSEWATDAEKIAHINDTYVNIEAYVDDESTPTAGQAWRWCQCAEGITPYFEIESEVTSTDWEKIGKIDPNAPYVVVQTRRNGTVLSSVGMAFDTDILVYSGPPVYIKVEEATGDVYIKDVSRYFESYPVSLRFIYTGFVSVEDKDGNRINLHWHPIADSDAVRALKDAATANRLLESVDSDNVLTGVEKHAIRESIKKITSVRYPDELLGQDYKAVGTGSFAERYNELNRKGYESSADSIYDTLVAILLLLNNNGVWDDGNSEVEPNFRSQLETLLSDYYAYEAYGTNWLSSDFDYLKETFKKGSTVVAGGLVMTDLVAVRDRDDEKVEAFLNGSGFASDTEHGKLLIAAGIEDGESDIEERSKEAKTRVYEDGHIESNDIKLKEGCVIGDAITIYDRGMLMQDEGTSALKINPVQGLTVTNTVGVSGQIGYQPAGQWLVIGSPNATELLYYIGQPIGIHIVMASTEEAIRCDSGVFAGLRPSFKKISTLGQHQISARDHTIVIGATSAGTVTLLFPNPPSHGQRYEILVASQSTTLVVTTYGVNGFNINSGAEVASGQIFFTASSSYKRKFVFTYDASSNLWFYYYNNLTA